MNGFFIICHLGIPKKTGCLIPAGYFERLIILGNWLIGDLVKVLTLKHLHYKQFPN
jgi:hypothetical protein